MALQSSRETHTSCPMGDSLLGMGAGKTTIARPRLLLCDNRQSWDPYLLYDRLTDSLLVWIYKSGLIHILASGVYVSGFIKDLLCLPRPLSPPLTRITMSGSVALEYGFPSTHATNAVSVATYALIMLHSPNSNINPTIRLVLESAAYCYAFSIVLGRIYCGMHGFLDVLIGSVLGALLSMIQCVYGDAMDAFMYSSTWTAPLLVASVIIVLVRIHPEPADDCPCFDDSLAFGGVMFGVELGNWHFAASPLAWDYPVPATVPFSLNDLGWPKTIARILLGVLVVFAWREIMKPTLLRWLPPLFRVVEKLGLSLPRKFFVQASEYKKVPPHLKDDNVMPSVSELPSLITSMTHPRRRGVSIGPQSAADAYETLAYRDKKRRESSSALETSSPLVLRSESAQNGMSGYFPVPAVDGDLNKLASVASLPTPPFSKTGSYEQMMDTGSVLVSPITPSTDEHQGLSAVADFCKKEDEREEREMFSKLEKPRVRYDVEVVTKLVVYTGIAWLAVEGNPLLFELFGLGMGAQTK
ncbi:MAG: hypothetical protein M1836_007596 [Candelina mexicana]|nr:MAG: hypothetical protein M1836_007596 [Candelina mexicana]